MLVMGTANAATITAQLDRQTVYDGESVTLSFTVDGSADGRPDFDPLEKDFDILSRNKSSSMQFINGRMSSKVQWMLSLMPKHKGQLRIPAIAFGRDRSNPLTLTVTEAQTSSAGAVAEDVFMQVSAEPQRAYVQSQIIYTVRIYVGARMNDARLSEPELSHADAVIERLGDDHRFETMHLGRRYQVIERKYAIFPQQSGKLHINPLQFSGQIVSSPSNFMNPFGQFGKSKRIQSEALEIDVKAVPAGQLAKNWLPASKLSIEEQWPHDPPTFKVGEAVTRTLILRAEGLTAAQLPEMSQSTLTGFKTYPDQAKLDDQKGSTGITGVRTEKIALIASQAGTLTLPEIKINWWNSKTNKAEVARLPARQISVLAADGSQQPAAADKPAVQFAETPASPAKASTPVPLTKQTIDHDYWPWISLALLIGWISSALFMWYKFKTHRPIDNKTNTAQEKQRLSSIKQAEKKIKQACLANDAIACKEALLSWARMVFTKDKPSSLSDVGRHLDSQLDVAISKLNKALYSQNENQWQGAELWQAWQQAEKQMGKKKSSAQTSLSPLYP